MKLSERGFTLTEALLVLSIFMILTFVTIFSLKPQYEKAEIDSFFTQLESDLYFAQQYALSHQHDITFTIQPGQHCYYLRGGFDQPYLLTKYYSKNITVSQLSQPYLFKFMADGNISKFGSYRIRCGSEVYRMTFLIGKGRFYVEKQ